MDEMHIKARERNRRCMAKIKADPARYAEYKRKWNERKKELNDKYRHRTPSAAFVDTVKKAYTDIAQGNITKDDAAQQLGYTSFATLDHARWQANLPPLSHYGWNPNGYNRTTAEQMENAYKRIANGQDKETVATEHGFTSYDQMDKRRINIGCPPLKYWKSELIKERYEQRVRNKEIVKWDSM